MPAVKYRIQTSYLYVDAQKVIVQKVNALMALCDSLENEIKIQTTTQEHWMQSCLREVFEK